MAKILNKKETREIETALINQWDAEFDFSPYCVYKKEDDIFIANRECMEIQNLRVNSLGLYFGEFKHNQLRLSIEASQIIGSLAKKNIVNLEIDEFKKWLKGEDIDYNGDCKGHVLIEHNTDFAGTGKVKENKILNFVPKIRRLSVVH